MLDALNLKDNIASIFDREDCKLIEGPFLLKEIERVGESLDNIVCIDDSSIQAKVYPENTIKIPSFSGDSADEELLKLIPTLEKLAHSPSIRDATVYLNEKQGDFSQSDSKSFSPSLENSPVGRNVEKGKSSQGLCSSPNQRRSRLSTEGSRTDSEESNDELSSPKSSVSTNSECDESNHSVIMDESTKDQKRQHWLLPSLPMRTKSTRFFIF